MRKDLNLGVAKEIVSNTITNEFMSESKIDNSKGLMTNLVETITKSPVLMNEYVVYNNIENKHTENDIIATKFIDHNIGKFSEFSIGEIREAHESLEKYVNDTNVGNINESKLKLYNSIGTLIVESNNPDGDINEIHLAYENVLTHIKENVEVEEIDNSMQFLDENIDLNNVVSIATDKFNEKYSTLNENERDLLNKLVYGSEDENKVLFEELKLDNIATLELIDSNGVEDKVNESIHKIRNMAYSKNTLVNDIIKLEKFKADIS